MHTHHEVNFSTDVEGLDEAKSPEVVRLRDTATARRPRFAGPRHQKPPLVALGRP